MITFDECVKNLNDIKHNIEGEIDGGEECFDRDSQLSGWIYGIEEAIQSINCLRKAYTDLTTEAQCE